MSHCTYRVVLVDFQDSRCLGECTLVMYVYVLFEFMTVLH